MSFAIPTMKPFLNRKVSSASAASTLLLHFDGTDGQTTTTDSSANNVAITINSYSGSTAGLSTSAQKFGTASWFNGGTGYGYISFPNSSLFNFGSNDWTIDFWYNCQNYPISNNAIYMNHLHTNFSTGSSTIGGIVIRRNSRTSNDLRLSLSTDGSSYVVDTSALYTTAGVFDGDGNANFQVWTHIAIERYGSNIYGYLNGTPNTISTTFSGSIYYNAANPIGFGGAVSAAFVSTDITSAYYDELRIVNGTALYRGNSFTPPISAYTS